MNGLFVTGTDTGVGKTTVAVGLVAAFAARGLRVAAMKPCETGGGSDAARLRAATGRALDRALVSPYRFRLAAAPEIAARAEGARISVPAIVRAYRQLARDADLTIVEGAGGLLVPLTARASMADLAAHLALPVVVVARTTLGTINHTLLTIEAARRRRLQVVGVVFSRTDRGADRGEARALAAIARLGRVPTLGIVPHLAHAHEADPARLGRAIERSVDLDALLRA